MEVLNQALQDINYEEASEKSKIKDSEINIDDAEVASDEEV